MIILRRFVIVGTRAMAKGKLPLNDMAGGAGRMDVLVRALMASMPQVMELEKTLSSQ